MGAFDIIVAPDGDDSGDGAFIITRNEEHNSLTNNILVVEDARIYAFNTAADWFVDDSNLYWDYKNGGNVYSGYSMSLFERKNLVMMTAEGYYNNAVCSYPLFKDPSGRDFTLADNSPALGTEFEPWTYNAGTVTEIK